MARTQVGLRGTPEERKRWHEAARSAGYEAFSEWARDLLEQAALGGTAGAAPPSDPEFSEALDRCLAGLRITDPSQAIRSAVLFYAELLESFPVEKLNKLLETEELGRVKRGRKQ